MNIPLNGRIAIVDDQMRHAAPLITELSKRQIPFTYFSGEFDSLPEETDDPNDVRVLFLDINLIDDSEHTNRVLKSRLVPVLKRVISKNNHPYVLVYWSRHEHHREMLEDEIFNEDLSERAPIGYISAVKTDYFNNDGSKTDDYESNISELFNKIVKEIDKSPVYSYVLQWENLIHLSADSTLQNVFKADSPLEYWGNNANYVFSSLSKAYLGKHYSKSKREEQVKAANLSLTSVFNDTLENKIFSESVKDLGELNYEKETVNTDVEVINFNLNVSKEVFSNTESGVVLEYEDKDSVFSSLLFKLISFFGLKKCIKEENEDLSSELLKKAVQKEHKKIRNEIKKKWKKIGVVVTPICDFAQNNKFFDRIVKGVLLPESYIDYLEKNSEAVYVLPVKVDIEGEKYLIVLDFRYFITCKIEEEENFAPIFRIRHGLLSEIQSKLSRHVNRQGILFLD